MYGLIVKKIALSMKYQTSKIVVCSIWSEVHRRYMCSFHYTDCIIAQLSASVHHTYLVSVHHSTYSKQQFLTSGISYSLPFYSIIKPSFLTKNYIIFGLWCNFGTI